MVARYIIEDYHKPSDEVRDDWDTSSAELDLQMYIAVARLLANTEAWPEWYPGSEFRRVREASSEARTGQPARQ